MGRMLETLKRAHGVSAATADEPAAPAVWRQDPGPVAEAEQPEQMPFIEVGGKQGPLEASPEVLACPVPSRPHPAERGPRLQPLGPVRHELGSVLLRPVAAGLGLPHARFAPELVAFHQPEHAVSRQYQALMDAVAAQVSATQTQVLVFTATTSGIGATTVVLNLAILFARAGKRQVLVVDANRDGPGISCRLGLPEVPGLREVLAGSVSLENALRPTGQEHLQALTAGNLQRGPAVRWHGEPPRALLQQLRSRFGLILIDAPCWEDRPEAALLATLADAVYVVSCEAETDQNARLLEAIARHGAPLRGQIFTGA